MYNARYFHYDGIWSGMYGLQLADFDSDPVRETETYARNLSVLKAPSLVRFFYGGDDDASAPECEFAVISQEGIPGEMRGEILSWLVGRKGFKPLILEDDDNSGFTYYCNFTRAETIWINGLCHGFRLTGTLDSYFARGVPTVAKAAAGTHEIKIQNRSDIVDEYVYPKVEFTGSSVSIINKTDDPARAFEFTGLDSDEKIVVDNELRTIESSTSDMRLDKFNKNWLRLRRGSNTLSITSEGDVTITCPRYALIGY